ncbi:zinc ribbon domain-containing protein [bacterium]|nr:zinc ribbon domain-containing protein [bacterium]
MPIYVYKCEECGEVFEHLIIRSTDKPKCSKCGSENLKKLPTTFGVKMGSSSSTGSCPTGTCPLG